MLAAVMTAPAPPAHGPVRAPAHKAALELTGAKLKREIAESSAHNAEANWLAQQCRVLRLENAKLRRVMRANHVRVP